MADETVVVETPVEQFDISAFAAKKFGSESAKPEVKDAPKDKAADIPSKEPAKEAVKETKGEAKPESAEDDGDDDVSAKDGKTAHVPRSARRQINNLQKELGRLQGRNEVLEQLLNGQGQKAAPEAQVRDGRLSREQFNSDAEYTEALAARKAQEIANQNRQYDQNRKIWDDHIAAMAQKRNEDIKGIPDFHEALESIGDDAPQIDWAGGSNGKNKNFVMRMLASEDQARLVYHFAKNPDILESILDMEDNPNQLDRALTKLEGRLQVLYDFTKAAQASSNGKTALHPAEEAPKASGRSSSGQTALPRPSSAVSAGTGGSTPNSDRPNVVTNPAAWFEERNRLKFGR